MSITGSLVGYENNNEICNSISKKNRSLLNMTNSSKQCSSLNSSISNSVITSASGTSSIKASHIAAHHQAALNKKSKTLLHFNTLWSLWYGILITLLQGYLVVQGAHRFLSCSLIQWRYEEPPNFELDLQIFLCAVVLLVTPLFLFSSLFKVGNLANDGVKLASKNSQCSIDLADGLEKEANGGTLRALWTHGGPTSAFLHILTALCLLLPRLLLEARLIENGVLSKEQIWRTDLDFMITHRDRLFILSFVTSPYQNISHADIPFNSSIEHTLIQPRPYYDTHLIERLRPELDDFDNYESSHEKLEMEEKNTSRHNVNRGEFDDEVDDGMDDDDDADDDEEEESKEDFFIPPTNAKTPTPPPPPPALAGASFFTTPKLKPTKQHIATTVATQATTTPTVIDGIHKKEKIPKNNNKNQNSGNRHHQNNGHKKSNHRNQDNKGHGSSNNNKRRKDFNAEGDDVEDHLELKPERELNFNFDDVASTKLIEFQKVPPPPKAPASSVATSASTHSNRKTAISHTTGSNKKQSSTKSSANPKDSDINIAKEIKPPSLTPDRPPITSTASTSTDSKIIEIKSTPKNTIRKSRSYQTEFEINEDDVIVRNIVPEESSDEEEIEYLKENRERILDDGEDGDGNIMVIEPSALVSGGNMSIRANARKLSGLGGFLQRILTAREIDVGHWSSPPCLEFLNFALAIMVWSVRYPSVFWGTSKSFAAVFSLQLIANGLDILAGYAGVSVLYKLQITGQSLPLNSPALILNAVVTISLYIFSTILIMASSMILYLYGHGRLAAKIRDRNMISIKTADTWIYFAHCASLSFVLALAVVKAPLMHDLSAAYRGSLDGAVLLSALGSVIHLFLWIVLWLGLTAKRRWAFKLPPLDLPSASQPLLVSPRGGRGSTSHHQISGEDTIYWPKLTPSSPKLKVTFNEIPSTSSHHDLMVAEHDGKRHKTRGGPICMPGIAGEADDGDYATLRGPTGDLLHLSNLTCIDGSGSVHLGNSILGLANSGGDLDDNTSEEGKLLACVRDDSVTYASTRDLEPPAAPSSPPHMLSPHDQQYNTVDKIMSPVSVTVHTSEIHISTALTPRCLRRADSGVPNEALTPRSDTTSTESSTSPPDRASSDTSSGVHSGEERDEVVIRPRPGAPYKAITKLPPPAIQEEPFGRSTNMVMSSFNKDGVSSATLPLTRGSPDLLPKTEHHCNTMPLPVGCHQPYRPQQIYAPSHQKQQLHTTLPNGLRYTPANQFLRRLPHMKNTESPYGHLGLGSGHHTFSKLLHDPIHSMGLPPPIPEDRDSANYSMASDTTCIDTTDNAINIQRDIYMHSGQLQIN